MFVRNGHATGSILLKDAPGGTGPTPKKRGRPAKKTEVEVSVGGGGGDGIAVPSQATRPELDKLAAKAGVDNPEDLPNKDAVREAIKEEGDN